MSSIWRPAPEKQADEVDMNVRNMMGEAQRDDDSVGGSQRGAGGKKNPKTPALLFSAAIFSSVQNDYCTD